MSNATLSPKRSSLRGATLPKWFPWAVAAGSLVLGYGISAAAGLDSDIQWALIAAVLFVIGSYAVSAKIEGSRQAKPSLRRFFPTDVQHARSLKGRPRNCIRAECGGLGF